jgi:hypothetical protein
MAKLVIVTFTPDVMDRELRISGVPLVPAAISITNVPPEVLRRAQLAVPVAMAAVADGNVGLRTPADADGANGVPIVKFTSGVVAVPPDAG